MDGADLDGLLARELRARRDIALELALTAPDEATRARARAVAYQMRERLREHGRGR